MTQQTILFSEMSYDDQRAFRDQEPRTECLEDMLIAEESAYEFEQELQRKAEQAQRLGLIPRNISLADAVERIARIC